MAIIYSLVYSKSQWSSNSITADLPSKALPPSTEAQQIRNWEVLGPIHTGKLSLDEDSTFFTSRHSHSHSQQRRDLPTNSSSFEELDVASFILSMSPHSVVHSDLMPGATTGWHAMKAQKRKGQGKGERKGKGEDRERHGAGRQPMDRKTFKSSIMSSISFNPAPVDLSFSKAGEGEGKGPGGEALPFPFKGWARTTTYARTAGTHLVSCQVTLLPS